MQIYIAKYLKESYVVIGRGKWELKRKQKGNILSYMTPELFHPVICQIIQPEDV